MLRVHLGSAVQHTIYEAELLGLSLAAELMRAESGMCSATISTNSQAAILAT